MSDYRIIHADVLAGLRSLPDNSVHVCVTSPPYYGLRNYGTERWEGGAEDCDHRKNPLAYSAQALAKSTISPHANTGHAQEAYKDICGKCGARRIDQQIGLEQTPAEYIARLVEVFAEVKRVLRPDGTAWVNMGDSYAANRGNGASGCGPKQLTNVGSLLGKLEVPEGLKPKDLMMMPARLAIALQDAGWWLRSDIIWCKRAPMPESVTDRPTSAHEHIFLLSKSATYFYDADAVRERMSEATKERDNGSFNGAFKGQFRGTPGEERWQNGRAIEQPKFYNEAGRNMWSYWLLSPEPYAAAHFATFPTEIPRRAILAGTSERGCCAQCGAPWRRVVEHSHISQHGSSRSRADVPSQETSASSVFRTGKINHYRSAGWQPTCRCNCPTTIPATVLDPFAGAGTTLLVASRLGRRSIGIELNADYVAMSHKRIQSDPAAMNMKMDLTEQAV